MGDGRKETNREDSTLPEREPIRIIRNWQHRARPQSKDTSPDDSKRKRVPCPLSLRAEGGGRRRLIRLTATRRLDATLGLVNDTPTMCALH